MLWRELVGFMAQLEETASRNRMVEILGNLFQQVSPDEIDQVIYLCQGRVVPIYEKLEFGVGESLTVEALSRATGQDREGLRQQFGRVGDYGTLAQSLLPKEEGHLTVSEVFGALHQLAQISGEGTVGLKAQILADLLAQMGGWEGRFLLRIPLGRLRLGIGDPTVMDGLSYARTGTKSLRKELEHAYNLTSDLGYVARYFWDGGVEALRTLRVQVGKPVRPALAERAKGAEEIVKRLGRCAVEPKFDGIRCQVHWDGTQVRLFSRNLEDFTDMFPEFERATRTQVTATSAIFEGEALAYDPTTDDFLPFQVTSQRRRKYGIEAMQAKLPLRLMVFDLLYLDGEDLIGEPYLARRARLEAITGQSETMAPAEAIQTDDPQELQRFFEDKIQHGLEGVVCKRLDAPYQAGSRNFNWIKLKRSYQGQLSDTIDTVVVGYWYGKGGRSQFGIGSLLTAVYDEAQDRFVTIARLGTGLSEANWVRVKEVLDAGATPHRPARLNSLIQPDVWVEPQWVLTIQADEITRSTVHTCGLEYEAAPAGGKPVGFALRFPRAVGFLREDKSPEDATTVTEVIRMFQLQGRRPLEG